MPSEKYRKVCNFHWYHRTVLMNEAYFGHRLWRSIMRYRVVESVIVCLSLGTFVSVAQWFSLPQGVGPWTALIFAGLALAVSFSKPFFRLEEEIQRLAKQHAEYASLAISFDELEMEMREADDYTSDIEKRCKDLLSRSRHLVEKDDPRPNRKLLRKCQEKIEEEKSGSSLWVPSH